MAINNLTEDLAKLLVIKSVAKELDVDVFYDYTPKEQDNIIAINEYMGSPTGMWTNTSVRSVQIYVRNRSNIQAKTIAWNVYEAIVSDTGQLDIGKVKALVSARNTPFRLGQDDTGRHEWVFNMGITYNYK